MIKAKLGGFLIPYAPANAQSLSHCIHSAVKGLDRLRDEVTPMTLTTLAAYSPSQSEVGAVTTEETLHVNTERLALSSIAQFALSA